MEVEAEKIEGTFQSNGATMAIPQRTESLTSEILEKIKER
jgi:hypothetical protein